MPQTIAYKTSAEEGTYEAATDAEVAVLVQAVEAAADALEAQKIALGPEPEYTSPYRRGEQVEVDNSAHDAYKEALRPFEVAVQQAYKALSESRNLPVGTVVRFSTSEGWYDSTTDEGTIAKVTPTSYVIDKDSGYGSSGTARISREHGHLYRSNYSASNGGRSLHVVRTLSQQRAYQARQAQARAAQRAETEARQERYRAEEALRQARGQQQALLSDAHSRAFQVLMARHRAEYDGLVRDALDLLALDAPGRQETAPLPETA